MALAHAVRGEPSPKSNRYSSACPSGSLPLVLSVTEAPGAAGYSEASNEEIAGARLPPTVAPVEKVYE